MHIVTVAEMRELEAQADRQYGLTSPILMKHAGKSAADLFEAHLLPHYNMQDLKVLFLIGPGNNGGDGLVMAEHLAQHGALISLYHWKERRLIVRRHEMSEAETAKELELQIQGADYIVDALLGTGTSRPLVDDMRMLLQRVERERMERERLIQVRYMPIERLLWPVPNKAFSSFQPATI